MILAADEAPALAAALLDAARSAGVAWAVEVAARCREARRWPESWPHDLAAARRRVPGGPAADELAAAVQSAAARRFAALRARELVRVWRRSSVALLRLLRDGAARRGKGRLAPLDADDVIAAWRGGESARAVDGARIVSQRGPAWVRFSRLVGMLEALTRAVELAAAGDRAALDAVDELVSGHAPAGRRS